MIQISKEQATAIRDKFGDLVKVTITNRQKRGSRKRYYVEETSKVVHFLSRIQNKI